MNIKVYGESDNDRLAKKLMKCRNIVSEIMNFGVDDNELLKIIHLLSLELENRDKMMVLSELAKDSLVGTSFDIDKNDQNDKKLMV